MRKKEDQNPGNIRVREVILNNREDTWESPGQENTSVPGKKRNTQLVIVTYLFVGLFLLLAGYMGYLQVFRADDLKGNIYNTKQDSASDRILRGKIITENGEELAYTTVDYSGNEIRVYPYYSQFAHVIGYASNGKSGIESTANHLLMTSHSSLLDQLKEFGENEKEAGDTVVVTLDPVMQQAAFYALEGYRGAIVVMEPDTGKILAMVSKPDFDPNNIGYEWEEMVNDPNNSSLLNRAAQGLYPPGSTFKILTALAYIREHHKDYRDFRFDCVGSLSENDVTITCYNQTVHGEETLGRAFANSCNTAFARIGIETDNELFRKVAESFLFNSTLPTDLPYSKSVFKLDKNSSTGEQMTTAIGQGDTLVTPLHMAMITSAVANGGIMMKPYYISRVQTADGNPVSENKPEIYGELMSVEEAEILTEFMKGTVTEGTGSALSWNSYSVAGKTGSAEYETNGSMGTHSWFVGFSNVEDPDIAVSIIAEDGGTGSSTAVPIAQRLFDAYYYR